MMSATVGLNQRWLQETGLISAAVYGWKLEGLVHASATPWRGILDTAGRLWPDSLSITFSRRSASWLMWADPYTHGIVVPTADPRRPALSPLLLLQS